jgi:hypothetical protein
MDVNYLNSFKLLQHSPRCQAWSQSAQATTKKTSVRASGITNYLENGETLDVAQRIAGHADSRMTSAIKASSCMSASVAPRARKAAISSLIQARICWWCSGFIRSV